MTINFRAHGVITGEFGYQRLPGSEINEQLVIVKGVQIGSVWQAWSRNGGEGWTNSLRHSAGTERTRRGAATDLIWRFNQLHGESK